MANIVLYDSSDPAVAGRCTSCLHSVNTPDYDGITDKLVNADESGLSAVPFKYWKESSGVLAEMSAAEKTKIDNLDHLNTITLLDSDGTKNGRDFKYIRQKIRGLYLNTSTVSGVNTGTKTFKITGDLTADIKEGDEIKIVGSTGNNAFYTVSADSTYSSPDTSVVVTETIPDATVDGDMTHSQFSTLSTGEKLICNNYFISNLKERTTLYSLEQQVGLGQLFNRDAMDSRSLRISKAISEVKNRLTATQAQNIVQDVADGAVPILTDYVTFGIEGTLEGDHEGMFDYLEGRAGTTWASTGFDSYGYVPTGYADMAALAVDLMKILKDGEY